MYYFVELCILIVNKNIIQGLDAMHQITNPDSPASDLDKVPDIDVFGETVVMFKLTKSSAPKADVWNMCGSFVSLVSYGWLLIGFAHVVLAAHSA